MLTVPSYSMASHKLLVKKFATLKKNYDVRTRGLD